MKSEPLTLRNKNSQGRLRRFTFALRPIACSVVLACCDASWANPTGPNVVAGTATFQTSGSTLNITNAPKTIINWGAFSIGAGEQTRFLQQSAASAVLNRVVGRDPSSILGTLSSNGRVFLLNPHGIVFGAGARIDTAGFIASTLNIADRDFLQGKLKFEGGGFGVVRNEGVIRASGDIMLVGPRVENAGLIRSDNGAVLLAAGQKLTITSPDAHGVKFEVQAPTDTALNVGAIEASTAVGMFAGTLRHSGDIRAGVASVEAGGRVVLLAQKEAIVESGATISARGAQGGNITVESGDVTRVAGWIDATGSAAQGGSVQILGERVALDAGARIDASGETGGGTILVGGDYQGRNPEIRNAEQTFVARDVTLRADAIESGDGGKVIVWADGTTRYYGSISARGGAQSGNGGLVEVSGKRFLDFRGTVDTRAPKGEAGTLLLDPTNIEIVLVNTALPDTEFNAGEFRESGTIDATSEITTDALASALNGSDVIVNTNSSAGSPGNINFNAPFEFTSFPVNRTLTLRANNNVNINSPITGDSISVLLDAAAGAANINANVPLGGGIVGALNVNNGTVTLKGGINAGAINLSGGTLDVTTGSLPRLAMTGGVLTRSTPGNLTIDGPFTASGGFIASAPGGEAFVTAGASTVTAGGTVTTSRNWSNTGVLDLNGEIALSGANFTNAGTLNVNQNGLMGLSGATFTNTQTGTLNVGVALANTNPFGGLPLQQGGPILNSGTINKTLAGLVDLYHPVTNQPSGRINVNEGTLSVALGGSQAGTIEIAQNAQLNTDGSLTNLSGARIGGRGTLQLFGGGGTLLNEGVVRPGSPGSTGTLTILGSFENTAATGQVDVRLGGTVPGDFDALSVSVAATLAGTLNLSTTSGYTPQDGDTFAILSALTSVGNFTAINKTFAGGLNTLYAPTFVVLGLGLPTLNAWIFDADGSWNNPGGWSLGHVPLANEQVVIDRPVALFNVTIPAGASFSADNLKSNENVTLSGTLGLANPSTINGTLAINGGTLQGAGAVTVNGALSLDAGTVASPAGVTVNGTTGVSGGASQLTGKIITSGLSMTSGSLGIAAAGVLELVGALSKTVSGATLNNAGTVTLAGTSLTLNDSATLNNSGTFEVLNDTGIFSTAGGLSTINNTGTFAKTAGAASFTIGISNPIAFVNSGTLDARTGTLRFGAANTFNSGTLFTGAGSNAVIRDSVFNGDITSTNMTLQILGTYSGTATFAGTTAWTGGTITGAFTVPAFATLNVTGGGFKTLDGAGASLTSNANGTINIGGGILRIRNAAVLDSFGTLNLSGSAAVALQGAGATRFTNRPGGIIEDTSTSPFPIVGPAGTLFANEGTFNKNIASAGVQTLELPFTNTGTVNVRTGTLGANGFPVNSGTIDIAAGATFSTAGNALTNAAGSVLQGNGTLDLGGATFTNNGKVAPGDSPGLLSIAGNFVQGATTGTLDIDLAGTTAGGTYDLLSVTGTASLDGTLNIILPPGFSPAVGTAFDFLAYSARVGDFATVNVPPGTLFLAQPGAAGYRVTSLTSLTSLTAPTAPNTRIGDTTVNALLVVLNDRTLVILIPRDPKPDDNKKNALTKECR